jgi:AcrR family transcriptional regulator
MSQHISTDEILDALRECVLAIGVRRTTFAEVARRADVSRMTLYRHLGDVQSGISELMTREFSVLLVAIQREVAPLPTARERLVEAAVLAVERLGVEPLFRRVLDVDAELLLPYVIDRLGGTQRAAMAMFREGLEQGRTDGSVRRTDAAVTSYCLGLVAQSFLLSVRVTEDLHDRESVTAELRHLLHAYLRPPSEDLP